MIYLVSNVNEKDMDVNKLINAENIEVYITHSHKGFSPGALFFWCNPQHCRSRLSRNPPRFKIALDFINNIQDL